MFLLSINHRKKTKNQPCVTPDIFPPARNPSAPPQDVFHISHVILKLNRLLPVVFNEKPYLVES